MPIASQNATNRAPFCDAGMSSVPAMATGWLATMPTVRPPIVASAVTRFGAQCARSSSSSPSSTMAADDVAHVVAAGGGGGDALARLGGGAVDGIVGEPARRLLVDARRQVGEEVAEGGEGRVAVGHDERGDAGARGVHAGAAQLGRRRAPRP